MEVVQFLNNHGLEGLTNIKRTFIPEKNVWILNYEQVPNIPQSKGGFGKYHPVLCRCRNLIVREESPNNWKVLSQSFRRFFNWNEDVKETSSFTTAMAAHKVLASEKFDGSLITITHFDDKWHIFTRGTNADTNVFRGTGPPPPPDDTFGARVRKLINPDNPSFNREITYVFELCTPFANITRYEEPFLALIAANRQGVELDIREIHGQLSGTGTIRLPEFLHPTSIDEIREHLRTKPPDFEGYVLSHIDGDGMHRMKLKTDTYVSLHHSRGKQFTTADLITIISAGEVDEVLAYIPEHAAWFKLINDRLTKIAKEIDSFMEGPVNRALSKKDFAIAVGAKENRWLYFDLYQGKYPNALTGLLHTSNRARAVSAVTD